MAPRNNRSITREDLKTAIDDFQKLNDEQHGRLVDKIEGLEESVIAKIDTLSEANVDWRKLHATKTDLLEQKTDDLEKFKWKAVGIIGGAGGVLGAAVHWVLDKVSGK
jgi:hypothetical protein